MYHLKVESLSKDFTLHMLEGRTLHALKDVSFSVEPGEFLAIVGRSGSGKSSLLRCIYRRYLPTRGGVFYYSESKIVNLAAASDREVLRLREREVGYVSQFLHAVPRTSACDVVAEPLLHRGADPEEARNRASSIMNSLGLPPNLWEAYPATMSGGERQRVNLARALVTRPALLLLDEPTSALDAETRSLAMNAIINLKRAGTTMLGVFHDTHTVGVLADRALVLEDGDVRWCGLAREVAELPMST